MEFHINRKNTLTKITHIDLKNDKKLVIPKGVEKINDNPSTYLKSYDVFNCQFIEEIVLPASLKSIERYAFTGFGNLKKITLKKDNKYFVIHNNCLYSLDRKILYLVPKKIKEMVIEEGVEYIFENCFERCSQLTKIFFPNSLKLIGDSAFTLCTSLEALYFPDSLEYIAYNAFYNCFNLNQVSYNNKTRVNEYAFENCDKLKDIIKRDDKILLG